MSVQIWAPIDEKSSKQNWKKRGFLVFVYLRILNTKKIIENKKGVCWILEICVKIFGTEMVMDDLEFGKCLKEMKEWMKWLRRWSSSFWRSLYSGAPKLATEIERERDQRLKSTTVVRCLSSIWVYLHPFNIQWFFFFLIQYSMNFTSSFFGIIFFFSHFFFFEKIIFVTCMRGDIIIK